MALDYAKAKNTTVAFGSVGSSYAVAIAAAEGQYIEVKNGTDKDVIIKTMSLLAEDVEVRLVATDYSTRIIHLIHSGDISLKHAGVAPTSGSVFVQSICSGQ